MESMPDLFLLLCRDAYNQRNRNQPIDFDYYKITAPDSINCINYINYILIS